MNWQFAQTSGVQGVCSTGEELGHRKPLHFVCFWFWEHTVDLSPMTWGVWIRGMEFRSQGFI